MPVTFRHTSLKFWLYLNYLITALSGLGAFTATVTPLMVTLFSTELTIITERIVKFRLSNAPRDWSPKFETGLNSIMGIVEKV